MIDLDALEQWIAERTIEGVHNWQLVKTETLRRFGELVAEVRRLRVDFCVIRERAKSFGLSPAELTARFVHIDATFDTMEAERDKLRAALAEALDIAEEMRMQAMHGVHERDIQRLAEFSVVQRRLDALRKLVTP